MYSWQVNANRKSFVVDSNAQYENNWGMVATAEQNDPTQPQSASFAPATPAPATDRDLQRAALRDLVALASECAATESQIEQKHQSEQQAAQQKLDKTLSTTEQRLQNVRQQIQQKYHDHLGKIGDAFQRELAQHKEMPMLPRTFRYRQDFEKVDNEIKQKLQQATWLADSVLEATLNQLRDESNKAKRDLTNQNELLDAMETKAGTTMMSYGVNDRRALPDVAAPAEAPAGCERRPSPSNISLPRSIAWKRLQKLAAPR